ncbi:hypothetical protein AXG93_3005s1060 [Marchantia polymorpha subsp. ruderalis]|uniref:Legume lectin domain-containing protein n=1 Tax=Marchantia polymorpha subsp. ruderalis TaxID=1480154 RepID=A0A176WLC4_MARPO|nr:hypothetical protein AXG93_3005s1060 [Marchantia polymorpha subsp. ruderalis]
MVSSSWIVSLLAISLVRVVLLLDVVPVEGQDTSFVFDSFDCLKDNHLQCTGDSSSTADGQLNLTDASRGSTGRVLYLPGIRLLDPETSQVSFFSTNFTFSMVGDYPRPGEGLAFIMMSNPIFEGSGGGFLGVYGPDGHAGTQTLAVEFDTLKNVRSGHFRFNDINGNHVGVDLESINSIVQVDAGSFGIVLSREATLTAWVDYFAPTGKLSGRLQVRISRTSSRPRTPLLSYEIDLSKIFTDSPVTTT